MHFFGEEKQKLRSGAGANLVIQSLARLSPAALSFFLFVRSHYFMQPDTRPSASPEGAGRKSSLSPTAFYANERNALKDLFLG